MEYVKPEIVLVADAVSAIQGTAKSMGVDDNTLDKPSIPAYQADE